MTAQIGTSFASSPCSQLCLCYQTLVKRCEQMGHRQLLPCWLKSKSLAPIHVTQSVPCNKWPHPVIGSTCVYLSKAMVVSPRPGVTSYLLWCGRLLPCSHSHALSSLIKEPPTSPLAGPGLAAQGDVSGTVERDFWQVFLRGGGSVPFFPLPPSRCPECSAHTALDYLWTKCMCPCKIHKLKS